MKYITIPGLEKPVSNLAIGSMVFSPERLPLTFALLDAFVELGGTLIDTAHRYRSSIPRTYTRAARARELSAPGFASGTTRARRWSSSTRDATRTGTAGRA